MRFFLRAGTALLFCLCLLLGGGAFAQPAPQAGRVTGRAQWDDRFLYLAFQVDDPNLAGTNMQPLSRPFEDDSVAVYLQVGQARPQRPDAGTHIMIVSAAGGFTLLRGQDNGTTAPRALRDLIFAKYAVTLQGTLNRADDRDQRFTVEMAIPWETILPEGTKPAANMTLGYNVVARARDGGLTSLAQGITSESETLSPARWTRLTLLGENAAPPPAGEGRFATRIAAPPVPVIDGVLRAAEWPETTLYTFAAPEKAAPAIAVTPVTTPPPKVTAVVPIPTDKPLAVERLLMARYALQFQGDPRRLTAFRGVRTAQGRFLLSDQPAFGAGPWFSSDRPGWHRSALAEMRRIGVDVALAVAGGPDGDGAAADEKALLVMVSALREMAAENLPAPQIALWLDTEALVPAGAPKPDLRTAEGRTLLYRAVRRYLQLVPPELRARVQLPPSAGGLSAFPIFLSTASGFAGIDAGFVDELRSRYATDFGGDTTLIFAGGRDFAASGAPLAAFLPVDAPGKGGGAISTYVVQPGFDNAGTGRKPAVLRPRGNGEVYRTAWEAALAAKPSWIVIDSWNDWARGTEVAASRQYGSRYADQTRIWALQFNGLQGRDIKWLGHNAPRRIRPGQIVTLDVLLQNAGATPLRPSTEVERVASAAPPGAKSAPVPPKPTPGGAALAYRWLQNGRVVAEGPLRLPLGRSLFPTQVARLPVGLAAARLVEERIDEKTTIPRLRPLPPGEYTVQVDMTETGEDNKPIWFGENGDTPLSFAVTVTPEAVEGVAFEGTSLPALLQAGETYPVAVRLRWLGDAPLAADAAVLVWQLVSPDGTEAVASGSFPLGQPLPPGQMVTLRGPLRLTDSGGSTLPPAYPEQSRRPGDPSRSPGAEPAAGYRLRWLLARTQTTEAIPGVYAERVALYPEGDAALLLADPKASVEMDAEALTEREVTVVNRSQTRWSRGEFVVGYHWFYPDGVEAVWKGLLSAPLPRDVEPGKSVKVRVPVRAPERDGEYVLAFDLARGADNYLSTRPLTRVGDLGLAFVRVRGGRLQFVDLGSLYNVDGVAPEEAPGDGDLDGKGATFPAESFPPDRFGLVTPGPETGKKRNPGPPPAYPSGYYADVSPIARLISFRYGAQAEGAKNAVSCAGQVIPVEHGRYVGLHLAAAATGGRDRTLPLVLRYRDNTTETVTRSIADWNRAPSEREAIAVLTRRKRTPAGDVGGVTCALRHVIVPVSVGKELVSITLPNDPAVKIFALTLER